MKLECVAAIAILAAVFSASAEPHPVSSVAELVKKLNELKNSGETIELAPGDYMLEGVTMSDNGSAGVSHLYVDGVRLRGTGSSPYATTLVGGGSYRVMQGTGDSVIENLTITGGFVAANNISTKKRGGGYWGDGIITNCVISGNKANNVGGGIYGAATLYDCIVENNESVSSGGGGAHNVTAYRTVFRNNKAYTHGGGTYSGKLYGCTVTNNIATCNNGGGCFNTVYATNTLIACNTAQKGGGAANLDDQNPWAYVLDGCIVSNNTAVTGGGLYRQSAKGRTEIICNTASGAGGGAYESPLDNCLIAGNSATSFSVGNGGGTYNCPLIGCEVTRNVSNCNGGGIYDNTGTNMIVDCEISYNAVSNKESTAYGGGICLGGGKAERCRIYGNAAMEWVRSEDGKTIAGTGGGASTGKNLAAGTLRNCEIFNNYAYAYGGGVRDLKLIDCVVSNNACVNSEVTSPNAYNCNMTGCDVSGMMVEGGSAECTVFHDVGKELRFDENPYCSLVLTNKTVYHMPNCTNCLFRDNRLTATSSYMFSGIKDAAGACSLVNCTIVSNNSANMFYRFQNNMIMKVVNSIIFGNRNRPGTADQDMRDSSCTPAALRFSHCAYAVSALSGDTSDWFDAGNYLFGKDGLGEPGFAWRKVPEHPYSLGFASPLLGLGQVEPWMAHAFDLRGVDDCGRYRRLRDGKVDLGCYQWWSMTGMTISIR